MSYVKATIRVFQALTCTREKKRDLLHASVMVTAVGAAALMVSQTPQAQSVDRPRVLSSLKSVPVPGIPSSSLNEFVRDKEAAIRLGKALFWDTRVGSDNKTACASCHFHAGADNRTKNQINPGALSGDKTFQLGGPNHELSAGDFPLTKFQPPPLDVADQKISDINDVISSQGVFTSTFVEAAGSGLPDVCEAVADDIGHGGSGFNIGGVNTRRVAPRNSPSVINAVYNFRNFWDGRGNNVGNGGDPFGMRNPNAQVWKEQNGILRQIQVAIPGASLVSQGSGPPLSGNEMSCAGRAFAKLGRKLVNSVPLADQIISPSDSVLGKLDKRKQTYAALIKEAFNPAYWRSPTIVTTPAAKLAGSQDLPNSAPRKATTITRQEVKNFLNNLARRSTPTKPGAPGNGAPASASTNQVTQMEANFALFFSVAVQLYQETLVSNDTPFDRFMNGNRTALNAQQMRGMTLFQGKANCISCHSGAEFTNASFRNVINERLELMPMSSNQTKTYDNGFYNIGVRPTNEDLGLGDKDPFGHPLSETLMFAQQKENLLGNGFNAKKYQRPTGTGDVSVNGAFKTPGLRNVEFTGPYFHNGGKATLMQVVDFYNRGGDFGKENAAELPPDIHPLGLEQTEKEDLVAFLLSLSDDRVRFKKAPFDHPSICIPQGHEGSTTSVVAVDAGIPPTTVPVAAPLAPVAAVQPGQPATAAATVATAPPPDSGAPPTTDASGAPVPVVTTDVVAIPAEPQPAPAIPTPAPVMVAKDIMKCLPEVGRNGSSAPLATFLSLNPYQR